MKNLLTLMFAFILFLLTACGDPCKDVSCNDVGTCDDGTCLCIDGYEGADCETESRTKYLGTFTGLLTCDNGGLPAPITIIFLEDSSGVNKILIDEEELFGGSVGTLTDNVLSLPDPAVDELDVETTFTFTSNNSVDAYLYVLNTNTNDVTTCTGTFIRI